MERVLSENTLINKNGITYSNSEIYGGDDKFNALLDRYKLSDGDDDGTGGGGNTNPPGNIDDSNTGGSDSSNGDNSGHIGDNTDVVLPPINKFDSIEISDIYASFNKGCIYYFHDVGESLYYIDGNYIKKMVVSELQIDIVYKGDDNYISGYTYVIDTHNKKYKNIFFDKLLFTTKSDVVKYISSGSYDSSRIVHSVVPLYTPNIAVPLNTPTNDNNGNIKYEYKDNEYYSFIDGKKRKIKIKEIIYTRKKSMVDFSISDEFKYVVQDSSNGSSWVITENEICENENDLYEKIESEDIVYDGCEVCNI